MAVEIHRAFAAILILAGEGVYHPPGDAPLAVGPGMVVLRLPGLRQRLVRHQRAAWRQVVLRMNHEMWEALAPWGPVLPRIPVWRAAPGAAAALRRAGVALAGEAAPWAALEAVAAALTRLWPVGDDPWSDVAAALAADRQARLDLTDLAGALGLGLDAFQRNFRRRYGSPPGMWRQRHRLASAAAECAAGDDPAAVARAWGFGTAGRLARAQVRFAHRVGC